MKKINEKQSYNGIIVNAYVSSFEHDGKMLKIEQVRHPGGVCVAALKDDKFLMVKQYRFGVEKSLLEFPAGLIDPNEDPMNTALRELQEETGYEASTIIDLGHLYLSPGYSDEITYLYFAKDLHFVGTNFDENEDIEMVEVPLETLIQESKDNRISDAKTIALIHKVEHYLKDSN